MKYKILAVLLVGYAAVGAQTVVFEERFPDGTAALDWSTSDGLSVLQVINFPDNPSADSSVGFVGGNQAFGNTGQVFAGDQSLRDYRIDAQLYLYRRSGAGSGTNTGVLGRVIPGDVAFKGYLLSADFDGHNRLRLRKFSGRDATSPPDVIRDWGSSEIPGGSLSESGWHKLSLEFKGDEIYPYFNDILLPDAPFVDTTADSGLFGVYTFVGFNTPSDSGVHFDDYVITSDQTTSIEVTDWLKPESHQLLQNYPNPFNPETVIPFVLRSPAAVRLDIVNALGQRVDALAFGRFQAGTHRVIWRPRNLPSGVYMARLQADQTMATRRLVLVR